MINRRTTLLAMLWTGAAWMAGAAPAAAREELVLIASAAGAIEGLDSTQLRKLFLGLTIVGPAGRLRPVLNESDPHIKELFLQNIVSMSDSTYDRYVLRLALLQGRTPPAVYRSAAALIDAVAADPTVVGYVWARDVAHDARIRVLRVLWHD